MSDPRPAEQEALWRLLRAAEPPPGARQRIRERVEARMTRRRAPVATGLLVAAGVAGIAVLVVRGWNSADRSTDTARVPAVTREERRAPEPPPPAAPAAPRVLAALDTTAAGRALVAGGGVPQGVVEVARTGRLRLGLARADLEVSGPASLAIDERQGGVVVYDGRVEIRGASRVAGAGCEAELDGYASAEVIRQQLVVTVRAGSARARSGGAACAVVDRVETQPLDPPARPPSARRGERPADAALARQVDTYWAAQRMRARDPDGALARLEELARAWPRSPLRHEIELAIIDILSETGRREAARVRARAFLRRYPSSPRREEISRVAE